jgi:hypothetical protein
MSKKKGHHTNQSNPLKHKRDYLSRLKITCDKLVGPGWFDLIPAEDIDTIYEKRYPSLTVKIVPGIIVDSARWQTYRETLSTSRR